MCTTSLETHKPPLVLPKPNVHKDTHGGFVIKLFVKCKNVHAFCRTIDYLHNSIAYLQKWAKEMSEWFLNAVKGNKINVLKPVHFGLRK